MLGASGGSACKLPPTTSATAIDRYSLCIVVSDSQPAQYANDHSRWNSSTHSAKRQDGKPLLRQSPRLSPLGRAAGEKGNEEAEEKAAHVGPPSHPAETLTARRQAQGAIEELQKKPEAEEQNGGQVEIRPEEEGRDDRFNPGIWIKTEVS